MKKWDTKFMDAKTAQVLGDRRFGYVAFHELSKENQAIARRAYPHKSVGEKYDFIDEHYYYPVKRDGELGNGQRVLAIPYKLIQDDKYMAKLGYKVNDGRQATATVAKHLVAMAKELTAEPKFKPELAVLQDNLAKAQAALKAARELNEALDSYGMSIHPYDNEMLKQYDPLRKPMNELGSALDKIVRSIKGKIKRVSR